jgi:hypothetical protein
LLKKRRKIRATIKTALSQAGTYASRIYAIVKMVLGFRPLIGKVAGPLRLRWPWALEADHGPSLAVVSHFLFRLFFSVFFDVVRSRYILKLE